MLALTFETRKRSINNRFRIGLLLAMKMVSEASSNESECASRFVLPSAPNNERRAALLHIIAVISIFTATSK